MSTTETAPTNVTRVAGCRITRLSAPALEIELHRLRTQCVRIVSQWERLNQIEGATHADPHAMTRAHRKLIELGEAELAAREKWQREMPQKS